MQLVNPAATFNCHYGAMTADYYPILARAVSRLPTNSAQARQELYERARTILLTQLGRKENSRLGAVGESVILETAILKVKAEAQSQYEIAREAFADSVPLHDADDKLKTPLMRFMSYVQSTRLDLIMEYLQWHRMLLLYSVSHRASVARNLGASKRARTRLKNLAECSNRFSLFKCHDVFDGDHIQSR